jgi:chloramphenicol 3-O-phosphotransferase
MAKHKALWWARRLQERHRASCFVPVSRLSLYELMQESRYMKVRVTLDYGSDLVKDEFSEWDLVKLSLQRHV